MEVPKGMLSLASSPGEYSDLEPVELSSSIA